MRILACQINVPDMRTASERNAHVASVVENLEKSLHEQPADLVVLPELSTIEYSVDAFQDLQSLAETLDGVSVAAFADVAQKFHCHVVFGLPLTEAGRHYISQVVISPAGEVLGRCDKRFLAEFGDSAEIKFFDRGNRLFAFDVAGFRCGVLICYDFRFPELTRALCVDHGVEVLLHSVAFARDVSFASWHHFAITRAMENQVYLLSLNRAGSRWGDSIFCPPAMHEQNQPVRFGNDVELRYLEVTREKLDEARRLFPFRADLENIGLPS